MEILNKVDDAKKLTDLQIREALVESKKWETKFDEIKISKVKIDKNVVGLDVSKEKKDKYKDQVQKTSETQRIAKPANKGPASLSSFSLYLSPL